MKTAFLVLTLGILTLGCGEKCATGSCAAPNECVGQGGQCVGLSPTACPNGHVGDSHLFSCGSAIGVECCLPGACMAVAAACTKNADCCSSYCSFLNGGN